jgi:Cu/Ag efflux pump CusA
MAHRTTSELIEHVHNLSRFFVEHRQVSLAALLGVAAWGWIGYNSMPQRKDPDIPVRVAVASCQWPGATAQQVEQLVTRVIEEAIAGTREFTRRRPRITGSAPSRCPARRLSMYN